MNEQQIKDLIKQYATAQHTRRIEPLPTSHPDDGFTAGANNCYWSGGSVYFGTDAHTTGGSSFYANFRLPNDYVAGTNITFEISWRQTDNVGGSEVVDYKVWFYYSRDGTVFSNTNTPESTWTGVDANKTNLETLTITGTNIQAGDHIRANIQMEDDDNNKVIKVDSITLLVPVNGRD
jgi:hypothetical protein